MPILVKAETEEKIMEKVGSGRYASADDVIGEALRLLDEHEQMQSLRAAVAEGLEGETAPLTRASWMDAWERAKVRAGVAEPDDASPKPAGAPAYASRSALSAG